MSTIMTHDTTTRPNLLDEERTLPKTCPSWCAGQHAQEFAEGFIDMWTACQHRAGIGDTFLPELRNGSDGRIWRPGSGRYDLVLEQDPHPTENLGNGGQPLVRIILEEGFEAGHKAAQVRLTTGEARVLAARLLSAADRADLS